MCQAKHVPFLPSILLLTCEYSVIKTVQQDNLRGADITSSTVAGSLETIGTNSVANNVRGGHTVHTATGNAVVGLTANTATTTVTATTG